MKSQLIVAACSYVVSCKLLFLIRTFFTPRIFFFLLHGPYNDNNQDNIKIELQPVFATDVQHVPQVPSMVQFYLV